MLYKLPIIIPKVLAALCSARHPFVCLVEPSEKRNRVE